MLSGAPDSWFHRVHFSTCIELSHSYMICCTCSARRLYVNDNLKWLIFKIKHKCSSLNNSEFSQFYLPIRFHFESTNSLPPISSVYGKHQTRFSLWLELISGTYPSSHPGLKPQLSCGRRVLPLHFPAQPGWNKLLDPNIVFNDSQQCQQFRGKTRLLSFNFTSGIRVVVVVTHTFLSHTDQKLGTVMDIHH